MRKEGRKYRLSENDARDQKQEERRDGARQHGAGESEE